MKLLQARPPGINTAHENLEELQLIHMKVDEGIVTFNSESEAAIALSTLGFMFTPLFDANVTITQILNIIV